MKELPYLEEIYDFETEQLETLFEHLNLILSTDYPRQTAQLPKGFDNFEKFERKALKLREHVELELEERKQQDDVISFFMQKQGTTSDFLNDDKFYKAPPPINNPPKGQNSAELQLLMQKQQQANQQVLQLNQQNLAKLPLMNQQIVGSTPVSQSITPSTTILHEEQSVSHNSCKYEGPEVSDVHSSISKQQPSMMFNRGGKNAKKDIQAWQREMLAKTKISSEATSTIQPIAQTQKQFGQRPSANKDSSSNVSSQSSMSSNRVGTANGSFYKPQLKTSSTKESANFVSGGGSSYVISGQPKKPPSKKKQDQDFISKTKLSNEEVIVGRPPIGGQQKQKQIDQKQVSQQSKQENSSAITSKPSIYKPSMKKQATNEVKQGKNVKQTVHKANSSTTLEMKNSNTPGLSKNEVGQWSQATLPAEDDQDISNNQQEEIESKYSDDGEAEITQSDLNKDDQEIANASVVDEKQEEGTGEEEAYGQEDEEEEKGGERTDVQIPDEEEEEDFYSHLEATQHLSQPPSTAFSIQKSLDDPLHQSSSASTIEQVVVPKPSSQNSVVDILPSSDISTTDDISSTSSDKPLQPKIRGKVQLIVDEIAVQNSALTTPQYQEHKTIQFDEKQTLKQEITDNIDDVSEKSRYSMNNESINAITQEEFAECKQNDDDKETIAEQQKQQQAKPMTRAFEYLQQIRNKAPEENEEILKKKREGQEERKKQIQEMIQKEKASQQVKQESSLQQISTSEIIPVNAMTSEEKKVSSSASKAPNQGVIKKKKAPTMHKLIPIEQDSVNGMPVMDYSNHYKSFYDIFVGQYLDPKGFDLQFVVRDTRNTYATFVSLMSDVKKKYQFDQAPLEKCANDYMQLSSTAGGPFSLTKQAFNLGLGGDSAAPGGSDFMMQALAQAELKDRYQQHIKHRDINDILKDAHQKLTDPIMIKASSASQEADQQSKESSLYYRVVKNRTEVYDIISRSFSRKRQWNELPHGLDLRNSWNLLWTWSKIKIDLSKLLVWQKCNHYSGAKNVSRKDFLKRNIEMAQKMSPKAAQAFNIIPLTYILPKEYVNFLECFSDLEDKEGKMNYWIMKPAAKSRGRGISVVNELTQISYGEPIVVQRYIKNPLLINGYKFDMRIYVLVTSVNPLEAFLYRDGFGRFSTIPFSLDPTDKNNKYIHLTNVSIQKYNSGSNNEYIQSEEGASDILYGGTKISLPTLRKRIHQAIPGVSWDEQIWPQVRDVIIKTLVACQNDIQFNPCAFELFGFDILVDTDLKCWLIEVNSSPSLARDTILDDMVKSKLIDDIIDLVDPLDFDRKRLFEVLERRINEDFKGGATPQQAVGATIKRQMNKDLTYILNGRLPRKYGDLPRNMGNFERICPSPQSDQLIKMVGGQKMFGSLMKIQETNATQGSSSSNQSSGQGKQQ